MSVYDCEMWCLNFVSCCSKSSLSRDRFLLYIQNPIAQHV
jgi:hypothetical protein